MAMMNDGWLMMMLIMMFMKDGDDGDDNGLWRCMIDEDVDQRR